jgi:RHS repeat-associated protein
VYPQIGTHTPFGIGFRYGLAGQLIEVHDRRTKKPLWLFQQCDASGAFGAWRMGNGVLEQWSEDPGRPGYLGSIRCSGPLAVALQLDYAFDESGNLSARIDHVAASQETFINDHADRLKHWLFSGPGVSAKASYQYDGLDNLRQISPLQGARRTFWPMLTVAGPHAMVQSSLGSYSYGAAGEQKSAPNRVVTYWANGLIRSITTGTDSWGLEYDPEQARFGKRTASGNLVTTVGELYERTVHGTRREHRFTIPLPGLSLAQMVWDESATGITENTVFLHADHLGSVRAVTDAAGHVVDRLSYEPFGSRFDPVTLQAPASLPVSGIKHGFAGHRHDDEYGLIDMRARLYDPLSSRFISPDAEILQEPAPGCINPYVYASNNPLRLRDLSGREPDADWPPPEAPAIVEEEPHWSHNYQSTVRGANVIVVSDEGLDTKTVNPPRSTYLPRSDRPSTALSWPQHRSDAGLVRRHSSGRVWDRLRRSMSRGRRAVRNALFDFEYLYGDVPGWKWGVGAAGVTAAALLPFVSGFGLGAGAGGGGMRLLLARAGLPAAGAPIIVPRITSTNPKVVQDLIHLLDHMQGSPE